MLNLIKSKPKIVQSNKSIVLSGGVEIESTRIINTIGYVILGLALLDYLAILIPPQLFNPIWEFQTIGRVVEYSWAILLGLMLIFYRRAKDQIQSGELRFISIISHLTLLLGIIYFLAAPLLISDSIRINQRNSSILNQQLSLQSDRVENAENRLKQQTETQLEALIARLPEHQKGLNITSTEDFKLKVLQDLKAKEQLNVQQIQQNFRSQQKKLFKNTVKWFLGALVTGCASIFIWKSTQWSRVLQKESKTPNMNQRA